MAAYYCCVDAVRGDAPGAELAVDARDDRLSVDAIAAGSVLLAVVPLAGATAGR